MTYHERSRYHSTSHRVKELSHDHHVYPALLGDLGPLFVITLPPPTGPVRAPLRTRG